jgi:LysM repeat protein
MRIRTVLTCLSLAAVPLALQACGGGDSSAASTTEQRVSSSTVFRTEPTVTASVPPTGSVPTTSGPQTYTVQQGDTSRLKVAQQFGVTVEALDAANAATQGYGQFYPGLVINIPAGGTAPGSTAAAPGTTAAGGTTPGTTGGTPTTGGSTSPVTTTDGACPGSYKIQAEDTSRIKVAQKFGITVEELDAANTSTAGYNAFYPGLTIVIPC